MTVLNEMDRFHLAIDVTDRVATIGSKGTYLKQRLMDKLVEHKRFICAHGEDMPEIRNWQWKVNHKKLQNVFVKTFCRKNDGTSC